MTMMGLHIQFMEENGIGDRQDIMPEEAAGTGGQGLP